MFALAVSPFDALGTPPGIVLSLVFVVVLPGYVLVAVLFPRGSPPAADPAADRPGDRVDGLERVTLTLVGSLVVAALVGFALTYTPLGLTRGTFVTTMYGYLLVGVVAAAVRRRRVPRDDRFSVAPGPWVRTRVSGGSSADTALAVLVALAVVVALSASVYAVAMPIRGEAYTEFYAFTETDSGAPVAADYPRSFVEGESRSLWLGIGNQEGESTRYTVVVQLQQVDESDGRPSVTASTELDRFAVTLDDGRQWEREYDVTPPTTGDRLRLAFLLYEGDPPATPTLENADEEIHFWISVEAS
nr:DUF1616 domain-containing protein [Halomarina oriensis]